MGFDLRCPAPEDGLHMKGGHATTRVDVWASARSSTANHATCRRATTLNRARILASGRSSRWKSRHFMAYTWTVVIRNVKAAKF